MTHQLSTAASGAGELYATSTGSGEHRQIIVVSTSGGGVTLAPSSANVVGMFAPSSDINVNATILTSPLGVQSVSTSLGSLWASIQGSTAITVAPTTTSIINLSSAIANYVTNSTTVPVYLGQSSGNVVGIVAQSSNWNLSTAALINLSTSLTNYVTLAPSSGNVVGLVGQSSSWTLAPSSGNVIGSVLQSSNWNISTGAVVGLTTTAVVGLSTAATNTVSLSTTNVALVISQTSAGSIGSSGLFAGAGIVASTAASPTPQTSGMIQGLMVDRVGALTVNLEGPRQFIKSSNVVTAANTCFQQLVPAPGAGLVTDIVSLNIFSTGTGSTTLVAGTIVLLSSSGQALPGIWGTKVFFWNQYSTQGGGAQFFTFPIPLTQLTANNAWGIYSSGAAVNVYAQYVVGTT